MTDGSMKERTPGSGAPPGFPGPGSPEGPSVVRRRAMAATVGIVVTLLALAGITAWLFRDAAPSARPPEKALPRQAVGPGGLSPGPGSVVPADAVIFRWTPVPSADRYEISVQDAQGLTVAHLSVPGTAYSARWPKDQSPPRPGRLMWKIQAFAGSRLLTKGRPIPFQVR